jgi:indolepyruvate ferredoxin oxidoreductase
MFAGLLKTKRLRGTRIDPFGQTAERKAERELIASYRAMIDAVVAKLTENNYSQAIAMASLADQVRGYDTVKMANIARYEPQLAKALAEFN